MQLPPRMPIHQRFILPEDLLIPVPYNKYIVEKSCCQHIDHPRKNARLHLRFKARMPPKMQIHRFEEQKPSSQTEGEQIHCLKTGIENGPILAGSIEITIDVKIEIVYVFQHRVSELGYG